MIKYVSGTKSLEEAELNPNAKALAESLGTKRQYGYVQGDVSRSYFYSQLTDSDAKMIEGLTGTTTIIDAMAKATPDVMGLTIDVAMDREDGSLKGDVSKEYLQNMVTFDKNQLSYIKSTGESIMKSGISVSIGTLNRAISLLEADTEKPALRSGQI